MSCGHGFQIQCPELSVTHIVGNQAFLPSVSTRLSLEQWERHRNTRCVKRNGPTFWLILAPLGKAFCALPEKALFCPNVLQSQFREVKLLNTDGDLPFA